MNGLGEYLLNYLMYSATKAQHDSVKVARESNKHPTVTRTEHGGACKWCKSMAGTFTDPGPDIYKRHGGCEGKIETRGYKSRNGLLGNYKKPEPVTVYRGTGGGTNVEGTDLFGKAHYVARDKATADQFGKVQTETLMINPKQIYTITSDAQYEALVRDAQHTFPRLDVQLGIPKLLQQRGFKAVEGSRGFDPLAGIAVFDSKLISAN